MTASCAPRQLVLDLPVQAASGAGDFLVSASNQAAFDLVGSWPGWREPSALIAGPPACGKSHLASVWQARAQATAIPASALGEDAVIVFRREEVRALVIEDIDRGIGDPRILFHLLNHARETQRYLLLTSRIAPGDLDIALPDLRSRLRALAMINILEPDDGLLSAVLVKLFADRQLAVDPAVISYLVRHMDRSFAAASTTVASIDAIALARQRKVSRAIATEALARSPGGGGCGGEEEEAPDGEVAPP